MSLALSLGLTPPPVLARATRVDVPFDLKRLFDLGADGFLSIAWAGIGSRETPADVRADMAFIAGRLAMRGFVLRSGGAGGADLAFEKGLSAGHQKEIFLPWKGFNGSTSPFFPPFMSIPQTAAAIRRNRRTFNHRQPLGAVTEGLSPADIYARSYLVARAFHPAWVKCSKNGARKLHSRNVAQVLGHRLSAPARFVICWTKDGGPTGGTGQAMRIAKAAGIPILNLHDRAVRASVMAALS